MVDHIEPKHTLFRILTLTPSKIQMPGSRFLDGAARHHAADSLVPRFLPWRHPEQSFPILQNCACNHCLLICSPERHKNEPLGICSVTTSRSPIHYPKPLLERVETFLYKVLYINLNHFSKESKYFLNKDLYINLNHFTKESK